jgi:hypothetical protein
MTAIEKQSELMRLLRAEFQRERASDFAMLRRIPSTSVRKFLDYFSTLDETGKNALAEALAENALVTFFPYEAKNPYQAGNAAYRKYLDEKIRMWDWKYQDVRGLRMSLAVAKREPESSADNLMTDDIRRWIESIKPVKSTEIRKVVKLALSQIIAPLTVTHNGGCWLYGGYFQGTEISVNFDFHQKYAQFDYGIPHPYQSREPGIVRVDLNYERLMGLSGHGWDCLEQANLDQSIALLKELVVHCAGFLQKLPDSDEYKARPKS